MPAKKKKRQWKGTVSIGLNSIGDECSERGAGREQGHVEREQKPARRHA